MDLVVWWGEGARWNRLAGFLHPTHSLTLNLIKYGLHAWDRGCHIPLCRAR